MCKYIGIDWLKTDETNWVENRWRGWEVCSEGRDTGVIGLDCKEFKSSKQKRQGLPPSPHSDEANSSAKKKGELIRVKWCGSADSCLKDLSKLITKIGEAVPQGATYRNQAEIRYGEAVKKHFLICLPRFMAGLGKLNTMRLDMGEQAIGDLEMTFDRNNGQYLHRNDQATLLAEGSEVIRNKNSYNAAIASGNLQSAPRGSYDQYLRIKQFITQNPQASQGIWAIVKSNDTLVGQKSQALAVVQQRAARANQPGNAGLAPQPIAGPSQTGGLGPAGPAPWQQTTGANQYGSMPQAGASHISSTSNTQNMPAGQVYGAPAHHGAGGNVPGQAQQIPLRQDTSKDLLMMIWINIDKKLTELENPEEFAHKDADTQGAMYMDRVPFLRRTAALATKLQRRLAKQKPTGKFGPAELEHMARQLIRIHEMVQAEQSMLTFWYFNQTANMQQALLSLVEPSSDESDEAEVGSPPQQQSQGQDLPPPPQTSTQYPAQTEYRSDSASREGRPRYRTGSKAPGYGPPSNSTREPPRDYRDPPGGGLGKRSTY